MALRVSKKQFSLVEAPVEDVSCKVSAVIPAPSPSYVEKLPGRKTIIVCNSEVCTYLVEIIDSLTRNAKGF